MLSFIAIFFVLIYSGTYLDIPREELEAKYATGSSQFLDLPDGARIHFRDEGRPDNPAIVLLHGFNGSLFNFDMSGVNESYGGIANTCADMFRCSCLPK